MRKIPIQATGSPDDSKPDDSKKVEDKKESESPLKLTEEVKEENKEESEA